MSKTETSGVPTSTDTLTVTVPADHVPCGAHSVVMHTGVVADASTPLSSPVECCGITGSEMPELTGACGVQVTSDDRP